MTYFCVFLGTFGFGSLYCRAGFASLAWLAAAFGLFAAVLTAGGLLGSRQAKTK